MKKIILFFILLLNTVCGYSQDFKHCGTDEVFRQLLLDQPQLLQQREKFEEFIGDYSSSNKRNASAQVYVIPVVFHIVHNYGIENISDAQVLDAINIMNRDFRKLNADTAQVNNAFKSIIADCEIEFRLAKKDPNGNCTNGIDRIVSTTTYNAGDNAKLNPWPRNKYYNIWVVNSIASGAAAYAYLPGTAPSSSVDGVIALHDYVGSIGTSSNSNSRTLTHETGHFLGLLHPWGITNDPGVSCGDDYVNDTPITKGWTSCSTNSAICNTGIVENVQNYMEYSYCSYMFTEDQRTRMRASLNSNIGQRLNLWQPSNLVNTGTDGSPQATCSPIADFKANTTSACVNSSLTFTDLSWNGSPTSWNWSFPGATPSSSTLASPSVVYSSPGTYSVSLTAFNTSGSNTKTKTAYITVFSTTADYSNFYTESFEGSAIPNADWSVNTSTPGPKWVQNSNAATTGSKSVYINNQSITAGRTIELISPTINISSIAGAVLKFKLAFAQQNASSADKLQVFGSTNCGQTWIQRYAKSGQTLATTSVQSGNFVPSSAQWRQETVNLAPLINQPNVMFKFVYTTDDGNNIYIDDINILNLTDIEENKDIASTNLFPNPANNVSTLLLSLIEKTKLKIVLSDMLGKECQIIYNSEGALGDYSFEINKEQLNLRSGIYLLSIETEKSKINQKLIFND